MNEKIVDTCSPSMSFDYVNYCGERGRRSVTMISIRFGSSEWHREPQWLMLANDTDRGEQREFAMKDMTAVLFK